MVSSANNRTNSLRYALSSLSNFVEINDKPEYKKSSRLLRYMANKNGDKFSPWRTLTVHENGSEYRPFEYTLDLILLYNCVMTLNSYHQCCSKEYFSQVLGAKLNRRLSQNQ